MLFRKIGGTPPGSLVVKSLPCNAGDMGLIPGWETEIPQPRSN